MKRKHDFRLGSSGLNGRGRLENGCCLVSATAVSVWY